ncbi:unnamed protein product [Mortierella alpina]
MASTTSSSSSKKTRRFSLIRLFNNSSCTSSASASLSSSPSSSGSSSPTTRPMIPAHHRHSMIPSTDMMQTEMMRERRKSIAALTDNNTSFRSMSLDLRRPSSSIRPLVLNSGRKESTSPQKRAEMTEKMRQFDELLLQGSRSSTIRISLTPSLLQ